MKRLILLILLIPINVYAGMPAPFFALTKEASFRLDSISFFLGLML